MRSAINGIILSWVVLRNLVQASCVVADERDHMTTGNWQWPANRTKVRGLVMSIWLKFWGGSFCKYRTCTSSASQQHVGGRFPCATDSTPATKRHMCTVSPSHVSPIQLLTPDVIRHQSVLIHLVTGRIVLAATMTNLRLIAS